MTTTDQTCAAEAAEIADKYFTWPDSRDRLAADIAAALRARQMAGRGEAVELAMEYAPGHEESIAAVIAALPEVP